MVDTFTLIKNLTPSEKRKISFQLGKSNRNAIQITLFKILVKQAVYDKEKIKAQFSKKVNYKSKYKTIEYDLQQSVLKLLRTSCQDKTTKYQLNELIDIAEILMEKKQFSLSLKKIKEGIRLAEEVNNHFFLFQFLDLQQQAEGSNWSEEKYPEESIAHLEELIVRKKHEYYNKKMYNLYIDSLFLNK